MVEMSEVLVFLMRESESNKCNDDSKWGYFCITVHSRWLRGNLSIFTTDNRGKYRRRGNNKTCSKM